MPTNILRNVPAPARRDRQRRPGLARIACLTAGGASVRLELGATDTADRIWRALPLHGTAETWGQCVHFETPVESGRDRTAKVNGSPGEIYFRTEEDRILVPFGPTPISRKGECRLPCPCNVWARALDDPGRLAVVQPGSKVSLVAVSEQEREHG